MTEPTASDGFKMTELGPLPEEWEVVRLGDVIHEKISGDWGEGVRSDRHDWVCCYVVRGTDFQSVAAGRIADVPERYVHPSSTKKRQLRLDDMLVEISGGSQYQPTGRILHINSQVLANVHRPVLFTNFVKLIRVNRSAVEPSFFHWFWEYLYSLGRTRIYEKRTTGIRNFRFEEFLSNEHIPLPPLSEQREIAHILSTVDKRIEGEERRKAALQTLFQTMLHLLMTGQVRVKDTGAL